MCGLGFRSRHATDGSQGNVVQCPYGQRIRLRSAVTAGRRHHMPVVPVAMVAVGGCIRPDTSQRTMEDQGILGRSHLLRLSFLFLLAIINNVNL